MNSVDDPVPTPALAMAVKRWRWWAHLFLIGGYFLPVLLLSLNRPNGESALTGSVGGLLAMCAIEIGFFATAFALGCAGSRASREQLLLRWRPGWWVLPLGAVYSIAIRIGVLAVGFAVAAILLLTGILNQKTLQDFAGTNRPEVEKLVDVGALTNNRAYFWLTLTLVSFVVAGLREEMWRAGTLAGMRALWPRMFGTRVGEFAGVIVIALFFGLAHLQMGLIAVFFAGVLGVFLGAIMLVHRSIWPAVIAHGFFDATTMALLPYALDSIRRLH